MIHLTLILSNEVSLNLLHDTKLFADILFHQSSFFCQLTSQFKMTEQPYALQLHLIMLTHLQMK